MVANLAEQAAERIGADSLLTRVGAYYHDIGKLANPHFFIENQLHGLNVHDQLDPATSAAILRNHVSDGLRLARQYRLPARLQAFIAEHHGKTKMKYQLALATKGSTEPPDLSQFTYPGPRPQSKETALVMLADGCEAIVRAQRPVNLEAMDAALREILTDRLADHQLDDSNLTLRDLDFVRQSFLDSLRGAYHPRIQYPQAKRAQDAPAAEALPESSGTALNSQGGVEQPVGII
jgi:putative nucleotidyltransferase with HDIG domain